jgi:DNA-binding NtrC family response regulator
LRRAGIVLWKSGFLNLKKTSGDDMTQQRKILLLTSRPDQLKTFIHALDQDREIVIATVESIQETVRAIEKSVPALVIVDHQVLGVSGLDIVRHLINVNAFIQTAVLSELDQKEFHERSEGLGILSKLPLIPKEEEARKLIRRLRQVTTSLA